SMLDGYQAGADQYIAKPFNVPELLTRIKVILRRVGFERQRQSLASSNHGLCERISRLPLTGTEKDLLDYLIKNDGIVVSKSDLQIHVLKKELCPFDRNLD
ncbi:response regulator transcription factor, partial [Vibrio sp. HI00D65]